MLIPDGVTEHGCVLDRVVPHLRELTAPVAGLARDRIAVAGEADRVVLLVAVDLHGPRPLPAERGGGGGRCGADDLSHGGHGQREGGAKQRHDREHDVLQGALAHDLLLWCGLRYISFITATIFCQLLHKWRRFII